MPALLETLFIDRFVKDTLCPERRIVSYNSKAVTILAIKDIPDEPRDKIKAQDVMAIKEDAPRLIGVAGETIILPRAEGIVLVVTDVRGLVQRESVLR